MRRPLASLLAAGLALIAGACASHRAAPHPAAAPPAAPVLPPGPSADILLSRARALRAQGDLDGARARLEQALVAAPASSAVRVELAELLAAEGADLPRAAALLAAVTDGDADPRLQLARASIAELQGDDAAAADGYARALALGADPDARLRRSIVLDRLGRADEALAELEQAERDRPGDPIVRARLAERYEAEGRLGAAEALLVAQAEAAPERPAGWDELARFYARTGRPAQARQAAARASALSGTPRPARELRPLLPSSR